MLITFLSLIFLLPSFNPTFTGGLLRSQLANKYSSAVACQKLSGEQGQRREPVAGIGQRRRRGLAGEGGGQRRQRGERREGRAPGWLDGAAAAAAATVTTAAHEMTVLGPGCGVDGAATTAASNCSADKVADLVLAACHLAAQHVTLLLRILEHHLTQLTDF
jgi:hypothetical protein